jgi:riboflavin synthase
MFTGLVQATGRIASAEPRGSDVRMVIETGALGLAGAAIGESIAVQGVCLTAVAFPGNAICVDVSGETLSVTAGLEAGREVNLERSLTLADRLGGHLVSGHVDGVGVVAAWRDLGGSSLLAIDAPAALGKYIAAKGSIAVDGVSLTVNAVEGARFSVNIIPHTRAVTTLRNLAPGSRVNLEVDIIARYVERMLGERTQPPRAPG